MDADSSMLSTPTSDIDNTFDDSSILTHDALRSPAHSTSIQVPAQTPRNNHLNALAPGELSPPRSAGLGSTDPFFTSASNAGTRTAMNTSATREPLHNSLNTDLDADAEDDEDEALDMADSTGDLRQDDGQAAARDGGRTQGEWRAGSGWRNKKAQEEMSRAYEYLVDRDFDIRVYGDPLA